MNERNDLLLEIGVEELPTSLISSIFEQLSNTFLRTFSDARLGYDTFQVWGSPRRMVIFLSGLQNQQEPIVTEVKGPARKTGFSEKGEFLRPALAFARSQKIQPSDLFVKETDRGAYIFGRRKEEGKPTGDVLPFLLSETIRSLSFSRSMLWGEGDFRFIRPIRWIVALYGEKVIPFSCAGVQSSNLSRGHRFFSSKLIEIHDPSHYSSLLEQAMVIVDPVRRRTMIESALDREAKTINGHWLKNEDLIAEVTFLVEYPDAKVGNFHQKYLSLPPRVLTMVMKH
ncbi:MAG: glycine--tRNA ligase subunit beta, partial [Atribacterota bacterium]